METKTDQSYGVIAIKKDGVGELLVLLVEQYDKHGGTFWAFPKGHPESGESPQMAATRELAEEVGLSKIKLDTDHIFEQHYTFTWQGTLINKTVAYFLGYAEEGPLKLQEQEIASADWFSFAKAKDRLTHQNTKDVLEEVALYLNNNRAAH